MVITSCLDGFQVTQLVFVHLGGVKRLFEGCYFNIWVGQELDMEIDELTLRRYSVVLVITETLDTLFRLAAGEFYALFSFLRRVISYHPSLHFRSHTYTHAHRKAVGSCYLVSDRWEELCMQVLQCL